MRRRGWLKTPSFAAFSRASNRTSVHPRIPPSCDSQYFWVLEGTYPRPLQPPPRVFLSCILVLGDVRHAYRCGRSARQTRRSLAYLHTRRCNARVRCTERKGSRLSFLSFDTPALRALIFDAAGILMLRFGRALRGCGRRYTTRAFTYLTELALTYPEF